jgi:hypothetical protein
MESSNNSEIYDALVKISQGSEISNWELQSMDEIVDSVKFNSSSPGKSRVKLRFEDSEDYWRLFDLTDDDIWFANAVHSNYDSFEFESSDWADDDWKQGYLLQGFNDDNLNKLKEILSIIGPRYVKLQNDEDYEKASDLIDTMFNRQAEEIKDSYLSHKNQCKERGAVDMIEGETCNAFQNYGIFSLGRCFYAYVTTVSVLLSLYKMVGDTSLTVYEVLEKIGKEHINVGGSWYDYMYEQDCVDFDEESYQKDIAWELEKIMTNLEEDGFIEEVKEFGVKLGKILEKYEFEKWYSLPKNPNGLFMMNGVKPKEGIIQIIIKKDKKGSDIERRNYNIDDFSKILYQYELFESKKFGRLK